MKKLVSLAALLSTTFAVDASACGGLFCNNSQTVNQTAERIIFAKSGDGPITQVVEIQYDGPSESFAWILPVPGTPEVSVSSSVVFDRLQQSTNPSYNMTTTVVRECSTDAFFGGVTGTSAQDDGGSFEDPARVSVLDSGNAGPYDYETIQVLGQTGDPAQVAIDWLEDNGYDVSSTAPDVLRPYLESGLNLIAFRLQKGASAGAIRPIRLSYQAKQAAIPIIPTSVAANDDMGIMVWVLGTARAIPTNYLGLELNEALINWFNPSSNYDQVVTAAANEAGGHGFVTEMADATSTIAGSLLVPWRDSSDRLLDYVEIPLVDALERLAFSYNGYDGIEEVFSEHASFRPGWDARTFIDCPSCYVFPGGGTTPLPVDGKSLQDVREIQDDDPLHSVNLSVLLESIRLDVLEPVQETAALFSEHSMFTRLYTTMSADEMTEDPAFDFNPDLPNVSNLHSAVRELDCRTDEFRVTLEDGTVLYGKGNDWPISMDAGLPSNERVVRFSLSGEPTIERDNRASIQSQIEASDAGSKNNVAKIQDGGCSAAAVGGALPGERRYLPWALLFGLGALTWTHRQRAQRTSKN